MCHAHGVPLALLFRGTLGQGWLSGRSGFQNKAHRSVLGRVIYCQGIPRMRTLRLSLRALFGSQLRSVGRTR